MKRREFLRNGLLIAGAVSIPGLAKPLLSKNLVTGTSLTIITDDVDKAAALGQSFFSKMNIKSRLKYEDYDLTGNHTGDLVFINNGVLFDFKNTDDSNARLLKEIAAKLHLPSNFKNPKLVKFISVGDAENSEKTIKIFSNNSLVKEIKLKKELVNFSVEGVNGTSEFQISQTGIKAISAPCGHKTCLKLGTASIVGDSLVCIPNKLRAVIYGNGGGLLDAVSF
ncbi:hypothetical protein MASR2M39_32310 [Ignavibacteriales bacterium]